MSNAQTIAAIEFWAEIVKEYTLLPLTRNMGRFLSRMVLKTQGNGHLYVIWDWDAAAKGSGQTVIGLETDNWGKVTGYDAVFQLPSQIEQLFILAQVAYDPELFREPEP